MAQGPRSSPVGGLRSATINWLSPASSSSASKALSQQFTLPAGYEGVDANNAILHAYDTGSGTWPRSVATILSAK